MFFYDYRLRHVDYVFLDISRMSNRCEGVVLQKKSTEYSNNEVRKIENEHLKFVCHNSNGQ